MDYDDSVERELAREVISAVRLIELLIQHANTVHASDVHIDPSEGILMVRMRIDGALQDVHELPMRIHREILARLKILAGLRIDEHQTPQDGRFRFSFTESTAGAYVGIRVWEFMKTSSPFCSIKSLAVLGSVASSFIHITVTPYANSHS
jgi:type II secretory ATPase GspE/PulE/Tfp pilus assembly ATPase PilB-like protein